MLDQTQTVADVVLDHSECAEIFQRHRIDFCCRGDLSIAAAAGARGVDVKALLGELDGAIAKRQGDRAADPRELATPKLVAHIVATHHDYLRKTLPFVKGLATKVGRVHGDHNPQLRELEAAVGELVEVLLPHLDEQEQALFPVLVAPEANRAEVTKLLEEMATEHLTVTKLLEQIRASSDDFTLPDWACNSYRTLFAEMNQLERDVFTHVHLENHVLKPRFVAGAA